jgi:hypothetical protein
MKQPLDNIDDELADLDTVEDARIDTVNQELEIEIELENSSWGIPGEIYEAMYKNRIVIIDVSHVSEDGFTAYCVHATEAFK